MPEAAFGIKYLPMLAKLPTVGRGDALLVLCRLHALNIRYIRFQWVDYTNITRTRIIPLPAFFELLEASRPGVGITKAALGIVGTTISPGFSSTGEYLLTPDLSSIRICAYSPGHASLMGWFEEKSPINKQVGQDTSDSDLEAPLCPRGLLRGIVKCVA